MVRPIVLEQHGKEDPTKERHMRFLPLCATALIASGLVLGLRAHDAQASPLPAMTSAMTSFSADMTAVEKVGWRRRYYLRHGVWPTRGRNAYDEETGVVAAPGEPIILAPVRPRSCGQYRFWNGYACVDARFNDPDLGFVE
jgi:hypothetical protein